MKAQPARIKIIARMIPNMIANTILMTGHNNQTRVKSPNKNIPNMVYTNHIFIVSFFVNDYTKQ